MTSRRPENAPRYVLLFFLLSAVSSIAQADPIGNYTVTNLVAGPITLTTSNGSTMPVDFGASFSNGAPVVAVSNGQATYAFAFTPDTYLAPNQGIMTSFPLGVPAPVTAGETYGNPANAYSFVSYALMNSQGVAAALTWRASMVTRLGERCTPCNKTRTAHGACRATRSGRLAGTTRSSHERRCEHRWNQQLEPDTGTNGYGNNNPYTFVYDLKTQTFTGLANVSDAAGNIYGDTTPYAIDDHGRLLLQGYLFPSGVLDTLLLTPVGVSSDPLQVPVAGAGLARRYVAGDGRLCRTQNPRASPHLTPINTHAWCPGHTKLHE